MVALYSLTLFLSAALLFSIQPLIAKAILPLLGGTPAVWTTCMLFFQAALLAAYGCVHWVGRLGRLMPVALYVALLTAVPWFLPIRLPEGWTPPEQVTPVFWLLWLLSVAVGLPFLAVACSAPLLQSWFAATNHNAARDPYFLYAASNIGSVAALLAYPLVVERWLPLSDQCWWWAGGYYLLMGLTATCALTALRQKKPTLSLPVSSNGMPVSVAASPWRWIALAFVPSSLLLGVTTYLTTDIATVPLLWVVPLAIYLLTFALTFARRPPLPHKWMIRVLPITVIAVAVAMLSQATEPMPLLVACHLLLLFVAAMVCHGELARLRPSAERLTGFYFCLALGGMLGGLFNGLLAPLIFSGLTEYPIVLVLACLLVPPIRGRQLAPVRGDVIWPLGLGILAATLILIAQANGLRSGPLALAVMFAVPAILCYTFVDRPLRFGLGVAALLCAGSLRVDEHGRTLLQERSFFGVHRVALNPEGTAHVLLHGSTVHGMQWLDPARRREPLVYYHRLGPIGAVFDHLHNKGDLRPVAVVGLGAGSVAAYGLPGQEFTFYEIDPVVIRIAQNPNLFTFLSDSAAKIDIIPGDARLTLANAPAQHYGLIVIDAFSSDAIPVHLLTREALAIYRSTLADGGILAFHVSNRYVDLPPVLGDLASDAGMVCVTRDDLTLGKYDKEQGKAASQWVLLAVRRQDLPASAAWLPQPPRLGVPVWTDDFCNLAGQLHWLKK
ncbi:MAG TPA: fused MFS/spermidine synthase [Gemmataceae bacterium]|nr:fused MFS/spermidine synthase [Gemmataceae bacterium]